MDLSIFVAHSHLLSGTPTKSIAANAVYLTTGGRFLYKNINLERGMIRERHWYDTYIHNTHKTDG
jgi:hypothetical protein